MTATPSTGALTDDELRYLAEARVEAALGPLPSGPLELKALLKAAEQTGSDPELLYDALLAERPGTWAPAPPWADVDPAAGRSASGSPGSPPPGADGGS